MPQRTGSFKSSGKDKPPFYRPSVTRSSVDSFCPYPSAIPASNSESNTNTNLESTVQSQLQPHETYSHSIAEEPERNYAENTRGIPTIEIVGSSLNKPLRSGSKTEPTKKVSKLPQLLTKKVKESKVEQSNKQEEHKLGIENSFDSINVTESALPQTQPRRNSLERPSYYNTLCKNSLQPLSSSMTRSLNLSAGHSLNGNLSSDSSASAINEDSSSRFSRYSPSRFDSRESSVTEKDYLAMRPYSSLSRTFSLKNPSVNTYTVLRRSPQKSTAVGELESRYSRSPVSNIIRSSSAKNDERFSSRFLRPKSFYEESSDLSKYQSTSSAHSSSITDIGELNSDFYSTKKNTVGRRSPSYQRSISLFEGSKHDIGRSSRITPDRSVLKKFLPDRKAGSEGEKVSSGTEINEKLKTRKVSRFLRPDFYDTPKENSVYEKKEKTKNTPNGDIWEEKTKVLKSCQKKPKSSQNDVKNETSRLSIVDKAIRSLKEHSSSKTDRESMERESNLIKRAVSLEDCSVVPVSRNRRSTSVTPQSSYGSKVSASKNREPFQKKKHEDFRKIVDQNLSAKGKEIALGRVQKEDSVIKKLVRKLSPKGAVRKKVSKDEAKPICNGSINVLESNHNVMEESGSSLQDSHSRLNRIAGLKRLEFGRQVQSAESTPSMEESKISAELDDSSSFLSPTEDGSDTWSISSDYADAREFNFSSANPEDSVSDRIRRKSFYSRFNQSKRKKSSQSSQVGGSRSRLPNYSRSLSSDFNNENQSKPI